MTDHFSSNERTLVKIKIGDKGRDIVKLGVILAWFIVLPCVLLMIAQVHFCRIARPDATVVECIRGVGR